MPAADRRLRFELGFHAGVVDRAADAVGAEFTPNQRAALISFDFNTGRGTELIKATRGDPAAITERMSHYTYAGHQRQRGLVERRRQEMELFETP